MGSYKTAAPCEVCGFRCKHSGPDKGFPVGRKASGIVRLVHERCRPEWQHKKHAIIASWPELRPENWKNLSPRLRAEIERYRQQNLGVSMARARSTEPFAFPKEVREWLKDRLKVQRRVRGNVKDWFKALQREHPDWMPKTFNMAHYNDFIKIVREVEKIYPTGSPVPPVPTPEPPAAEPPPPAPLLSAPAKDAELEAMVRAVHALVDVAYARGDRPVIELTLEVLDQLFHPPKPAS